MATAKINLLTAFIMIFGVLLSCANSNSKSEDHKNQDESRTKVLFNTDYGDITIALYNETPLHRDNFIKLTKEAFYDSLLFHRVINEFMIQAGDPGSKNAKPGQALGAGGPGYTIEAEIKPELIHKKGVLAAARQGDHVNPEKRSSGSQFYIIQGKIFSHQELDDFEKHLGKSFTQKQRKTYTTKGGTPHLDNEYTVFGEVVKGLDVIDKIAEVETNQQNRPVEDIRIIKATIIE